MTEEERLNLIAEVIYLREKNKFNENMNVYLLSVINKGLLINIPSLESK